MRSSSTACRVADAGVDVAEGLQPEQRGGVVDVVEHEGGGLVDRGCARARRGIGLRARMDGKGGETGCRSVIATFALVWPRGGWSMAR